MEIQNGGNFMQSMLDAGIDLKEAYKTTQDMIALCKPVCKNNPLFMFTLILSAAHLVNHMSMQMGNPDFNDVIDVKV